MRSEQNLYVVMACDNLERAKATGCGLLDGPEDGMTAVNSIRNLLELRNLDLADLAVLDTADDPATIASVCEYMRANHPGLTVAVVGDDEAIERAARAGGAWYFVRSNGPAQWSVLVGR
jgi:hypothetical protein